MTNLRRIFWVLSLLVLLVTGVLGLYSGITERGQAEDALQLSIAYGVVAYGILGVAAAVGLLFRKRWTLAVCVAWGVIVTYVASMAAFAYAPDEATIVSGVSAGIATALIVVGVLWTVRATIKR
jgi:hypothetical protein